MEQPVGTAPGERLGDFDGFCVSPWPVERTDGSRSKPTGASGAAGSGFASRGRLRSDPIRGSFSCRGERNMNRELELVRAISIAADGFYGDAKAFGEIAAKCFKDERGGKSQIKNLESIANSALKVSDVLDFIKRNVGKDARWRTDNFGRNLL